MNLEFDVADAVGQLDATAWDALVGRASPFLEHGFLATLETTGCVGRDTGWTPQILCARRDGELVGALPMYIKTHSAGEFVFDWSWADAAQRAGIAYYPKAVVAVPLTPISGRRILVDPADDDADELRRALVERAIDFAESNRLSSLHFDFIDPDERAVFDDLGIPIRLGKQYHWYNGPELGDGPDYAEFDDYLGRFRSKKRSNIRRERRKLADAGVTTEVLTGDAVTEAHLARMFEYYKDTIDKIHWGRQYLNRDFFIRVGQALSERVHLVLASRDGREFGGAFNLYKGPGLYGRYWGCAEEVDFTHFEVCMYRPVQWCIDHGVQVFEPGAQGEHKYDRGFQPTPTYSAHWFRDGRLGRAVTDFIDHESQAVDADIAQMRRDSPYKD